jgi:hypothetical protein
MRTAIVVLALLGAGCAHSTIAVSGSATTWALLGIFLVAAEYGGSEGARERGLEGKPESAGPMDENRRVNLVDCTKPIADWSANLHCK